MQQVFESLALGFSVALQPDMLLYALIGCVVGTLVGMLPGIGPLAGISILLPLTFGLDPTKAIIMLAGIYYGSQYGGSTTSILLRIPGEAASVMTCIDGNAMAQERPGRCRALHRRHRLVRRRHLRRHHADAHCAAARDALRCASARRNIPRCWCSA